MTALSLAPNESEVEFTIGYDGDAVASRRMAVRDLAPAMLALSDLLEYSAAEIHGADVRLRVDVKANFREGSFKFDLIATAAPLADLLRTNLSVSDIATILSAIGVTGKGLLWVMRRIKSRRVQRVELVETSDGPKSLFTVDSGGGSETIITEDASAKLYRNPKVMDALEAATEPLRRPGYDALLVQMPGEPVRIVAERADADTFRAPPAPDVTLQDTTREELIRVVSPSLEGDYKWRVKFLGDKPFMVAVRDYQFLAQVERREITFGAEDVLRVEMRTVVTRSATGEETRIQEVVRVVEYIEGPRVVQGDLLRDR